MCLSDHGPRITPLALSEELLESAEFPGTAETPTHNPGGET